MLKDTIAHREVHHKKHVQREPILHQPMLQVAQHVHLELILIQVQQAVHHVLKDPTHQTAEVHHVLSALKDTTHQTQEVHHAQSALQAIILTPEQAVVLNALQDIIQVPGLVVVPSVRISLSIVLSVQTLSVQSARMDTNQMTTEPNAKRKDAPIRPSKYKQKEKDSA